VSGPLVDQGLVGSVPAGRDESSGRFDIQYGPASWRGFSLEGQLEYNDRGYGNTLNRADIPARFVLNLGMRYRFQAYGASGNIRARVQNVTNTYSWDLQGGNNFFFQYLPQRRFTVSVAADF
jgi:iron complex outermembrane receptor protein